MDSFDWWKTKIHSLRNKVLKYKTLCCKGLLKDAIIYKNVSYVTLIFSRFHITSFEPVCEKTNNLGSDQVRHKPGCTVTEDS